jgi:hypothetical protein
MYTYVLYFYIIFPAALDLGSTQRLTEIITKNLHEGWREGAKHGRRDMLTNSSAMCEQII